MFFNSFTFIGFFALVLCILAVQRMLCRSVVLRNATLLAASYYFYGYFNAAFLAILIFVTLTNYVAGNLLLSGTNRRKSVVAIASILSLLPLAVFKYALFLCRTFSELLRLELNFELLDGLLLPVGISFFTFQAMSYTIDAYRGKIEQKANLLDFSLFVAFFPTILSGPIEKARNLLPQLQRYAFPSAADIAQGGCIFVWGLFKKMVVADRLAYYVDWVYGTHSYQNGSTLALAAAFYSLQIYCDFSGYSDMALGVAKALGFDVTKNFRQPYFSRTFKDFWRKWHIALTSWFTEYVYFSLGGSRVAHKWRWVLNISTIFLLSGIWHGAAWSFVAWGALHALYYLAEHFLGLQRSDRHWNILGSATGGICVFVLATVAWIFFRVPSFADATDIISCIATGPFGKPAFGASTFTFACTLMMLFVFLAYELLIRRKLICFDVAQFRPQLYRTIAATIPLLILLCMFSRESDSFVYFQF